MSSLSPQERERLAALAKTVGLLDVRVIQFGAELLQDAPTSVDQITTKLEPHLHWERMPWGGFAIVATFELRAQPADSPHTDFLRVNYRVAAYYQIQGAPPDPALIQLFARTNGMIHIWPYFRSFVQQSCAQLAVPPLVLSPFRIES